MKTLTRISGARLLLKVLLPITLSLVLGSTAVSAESSRIAARSTIITMNNSDSYFRVNGQQRFLFGRNPTGDAQDQFDELFAWSNESGETVMRIHITHGKAPQAGAGEVDEAWAAYWDGIFDLAARNGLFVLPVFGVWADWNDGSKGTIWHAWDRNPYNQELGGPAQAPSELFRDTRTRQLYLQWLQSLVSRWQDHSNIIAWEIFSELDLVLDSTEQEAVNFVEAAAAVIRAADKRNRPITASLSSTKVWPLLFQSNALDIVQTHPYSVGSRFGGRLDELIIHSVRERMNYGKPVLIGESGLDPRGANVGINVLPRAHIGMRHAIWASTVSGAMNGRMFWWEDGYDQGYPVDLRSAYKHASLPVTQLVRDLDFSGFSPVTLKLSGELTGAAVGDDEMVLVWVRDSHCILPDWPVRPVSGEAVTLSIQSRQQSWQVRFYDGVAGNLLETAPANRKGGEIRVTLPSFQDSLAFILEPAPPAP
jgi:hypothetical protein